MKQSLFSLRLKHLYTQRNLLFAMILGLVTSNVMLGFCVWAKQETIILIPPELNRPLTFTSRHPSPSYLEEMSVFFAQLVLDNSAGSFPYNQKVILRYVSPESSGMLKKQLLAAQERYERENLSTHFRPLEVVVSPAGQLKASVTGELETFVSGTRVSSTKETFVITYGYKNGFLSLTSFQSQGVETQGDLSQDNSSQVDSSHAQSQTSLSYTCAPEGGMA